VYEVGEELGIAQVPRRWLQLVGKKADSASSSNGIDRARTGGT
jgi:hypothetical protein